MILTCQNCSTSFRLEERLLKPSGSKVRCSRCKHIWRAQPPAAEGGEPEIRMETDGQPDSGAAAVASLGAGAGMAAMLMGDDQTPGEAAEPTQAKTAAPGPPELKLGHDEPSALGEVEDDGDLVTDEINLDGLDLLLDDEPLPSGPEPEDDFKTEELKLADLEKMLGSDEDEMGAPEAPATDDLDTLQEETEEGIIEDLDLDMDDLESLLEEDADLGGGLETPGPADAAGEEVELDLSSELEDLLEDDAQEIDIEETEEIGLSEVEDTASDSTADVIPDEPHDDGEMNLELAPGLDSLFDEVEDQDVPLEETEELDFSALENEIWKPDQDTGEPEEGLAALEIDLDDDEDADAGVPTPAMGDDSATSLSPAQKDGGPSADAVDELGLGDLESSLDMGGDEPPKLSPGEEQPELVLELDGDTNEPSIEDDLDFSLDDFDLGAPEPSDADEVEETRELDLDELESLLDDVDAPLAEAPEELEAQEIPETDVEGLELDLDLDAETGGDEEEPDDATRELNLDDIEKILESQEAAPMTPPIDGAPEDDLELDLDIGDGDAAPAADLLGDDETTAGSDALDLSDIEKMLEVEDTTDSPSLPADDAIDDLDLDFELQPATDDGEELELEFDMLDDEGEEASALFDTSESEDLGLDLDVGDTPAPEKVELEEDLEFEIMDEGGNDELELDIAEDGVDGGGDELDLDILEDGSDDLDLDILEDGADDFDLDIIEDDEASIAEPVETAALGAAGAVASRDLTQELMDEMAAADTQTMDIPPAETKPIKPAPVRKKKKTNKMLVLLLLLVLLGAGAFYLYTTAGFDFSKFKLSDLPQIPFVSEWLGAKKMPEAVVPVEATLKGSWIQNKNDGRLYIIQGRVKNEYTQPRSYIRVTGRIFADGRKFKRAAQAYCGNMPSREDLENLPVADLQKILSNRNGADNINAKVASGKEVPFTVIFPGLPEDVELQEYAVEISGSLPATKSKSK